MNLFLDYVVKCEICKKELNIEKEHNHITVTDLIVNGKCKVYTLCNSCRDKVKRYIELERQKCLE